MTPSPRAEEPFSLVAGGPAHWLQLRLGLVRADTSGLATRAALAALLTWVPLLLLSFAQGLAAGHEIRVPFLCDFAAYTRFLVALPILILSEGLVERRVAHALRHFLHSGLIPEQRRADYESALHRAKGLRDSRLAEAIVLAVAIGTIVFVRNAFPFDFSTWRSTVTAQGHLRTWAGWWYLVVGLGLFFFLCWRWVWRILVWYGLLWWLSNLDLRLTPTHPDRSAGLGFIGETQWYFGGVVFAFSASLAGVLADEIVYARIPLKSYEMPILGYLVVVLLVLLGPLLMVIPPNRIFELISKALV